MTITEEDGESSNGGAPPPSYTAYEQPNFSTPAQPHEPPPDLSARLAALDLSAVSEVCNLSIGHERARNR
jgi:hypothetical protein